MFHPLDPIDSQSWLPAPGVLVGRPSQLASWLLEPRSGVELPVPERPLVAQQVTPLRPLLEWQPTVDERPELLLEQRLQLAKLPVLVDERQRMVAVSEARLQVVARVAQPA